MTNLKTPDQLRGLINRLIDSWDRDRARGVEMKSEYARANGPMIWSLTHHTTRLARTVVHLSNSGDMLVAAPLIRLCIENAMTASWLLVGQDAASALIHEGLRQRKAAIDGILNHGGHSFDAADVERAADELDEFEGLGTGEGRHIEQRFTALVGGAEVYSTYRIASSLSHAGMVLADFYLRVVQKSEDAPLGIALNPDPDAEKSAAWLGTTAAMLALAMNAFNAIDKEGRQKSQVESALRQLGVSGEIVLVNSITPAT